jgi:hypothetical protein
MCVAMVDEIQEPGTLRVLRLKFAASRSFKKLHPVLADKKDEKECFHLIASMKMS